MPELNVKQMLEAGVHFGHQTSRWNPKMKPFIFTARNGIHIIDLEQTVKMAMTAYKQVADVVSFGGSALFIGTKRQAADIVREQAERVNMYYVNHRWLGGMLTNFKTIKQSIDKLHALYAKRDAGEFSKLSKKEALGYEREIVKYERSLGGIKDMTKVPGVIIVVDPKKEVTATMEANRLGIPVVAIADTNCDPDGVDYLIPANDDAIRSIQLILNFLGDAVEEGVQRRANVIREEMESKKDDSSKPAGARVREQKIGGKGRAYVGRGERTGDRGGDRNAPTTTNKPDAPKS